MDQPASAAQQQERMPMTTHTTSQVEHDSSDQQSKLEGYALFHHLGDPKYVLGPMVDNSELAFRALVKRYGVHLCYSPMLNVKMYCTVPQYRDKFFTTCDGDCPLVVQLAGGDPELMVQAATMVAPHCDMVDVNLGCPQRIARRGGYGSFLQDDWPLIASIVTALHERAPVPVSCKIRVFPDVNKTLQYAHMLVKAGCQILTVHGRTREQRGTLQGLADWSQIRAVKQAVSIPVIANGNIRCLDDAKRCMRETGVDAVMCAEPLLYAPAMLYDPSAPPPPAPRMCTRTSCMLPALKHWWNQGDATGGATGGGSSAAVQSVPHDGNDAVASPSSTSSSSPPSPLRLAREYLELACQPPHGPTPLGFVRGHLYKILADALAEHPDLRPVLGASTSFDALFALHADLLKRLGGEAQCPPQKPRIARGLDEPASAAVSPGKQDAPPSVADASGQVAQHPYPIRIEGQSAPQSQGAEGVDVTGDAALDCYGSDSGEELVKRRRTGE